MLKVDEMLRYPNRYLRSYGGKLLFGPVGDRLFCDCLNREPGFCGHVDFIHKMNIDQLYTVDCSTKPDYITMESVWYPSCLVGTFEDDAIRFQETKSITQNDIAFSAQEWENKSEDTITLTLANHSAVCVVEKKEDYIWVQMPEARNTIQVGAAVWWDASDTDSIKLRPGEKVSFTIAAATGNLPVEEPDVMVNKLKEFFEKNYTPEKYVEENQKEFGKFFDQLPTFDCSDPILNKTWYYRWYILRHCTSKPNYGYLKHTTVYEGRGHKTGKIEPLRVSGWEFSRLICLSTPLQMTDYKWCPDKELLHEIVRGYFDTEDENGICQSAFVHHKGSPFANFMVWAVYQMYLLDGDKEFIKEVLPKLQKCVDGNTAVYGAKNDYLQIEVKHQRTGKEFQPSYWYFNNFPKNGKDKSLITPLKRLDTTVYHYLNVKGLYKMMEAVGDEQAGKYKEFADTLAKQINEKTWDEETKFYYDLHHETDEKALVKNIVGFYPFWAEIADETKTDALEYLFDPNYFSLGSVFATTAKDCPAFTAVGGWMGTLKSRDGCVWDGPSWPYTNGIMLDMLGTQSKKYNHRFDAQFKKYLREYTLQHYRMQDVTKPYLVEQYHALTGEALSDEPDYNHSYYLQLLIGHVAGVSVQADSVVVDPVDIGLHYFELDNVWIRGKKLKVSYSDKERPEKGLKKGFYVFVDNEKVIEKEKPERVEISW